MARFGDRLAQNAGGAFYVDSTCIDCATCRTYAPAVFAPGDGFSFVHRQPRTPLEESLARRALVACPTGSIGTHPVAPIGDALTAFPERLDGNVHFCGYTSKDSFGAWSWLVTRSGGNVLVDSPRAARPLVDRIAAMGGVSRMFLTHRDDVADHARFRKLFGCERVLHEDDVTSGTEDVELRLTGREPVRLDADGELVAIPTPGHTRGHAVLLYAGRYLFTGDHLAYSSRRGHLVGFRSACWYSWPEQIDSMERLLDHEFEWVLPGHGEPYRAASAAGMRRELERCLAWMKSRR